jgi:RecJ-like exonuclease
MLAGGTVPSCNYCQTLIAPSAQSCPRCGNTNFHVERTTHTPWQYGRCPFCDGAGRRQWTSYNLEMDRKDYDEVCSGCRGRGRVRFRESTAETTDVRTGHIERRKWYEVEE